MAVETRVIDASVTSSSKLLIENSKLFTCVEDFMPYRLFKYDSSEELIVV
jgi:hypothetical protein